MSSYGIFLKARHQKVLVLRTYEFSLLFQAIYKVNQVDEKQRRDNLDFKSGWESNLNPPQWQSYC
jgi:hypothetical protein